MTVPQIAQVETIADEFIGKNFPVYTKEVPLAEGKKIRGLRAVFGETYPDPIRVVSIKIPVDELMKDPENPAWEETAIEFCGGT